RGFLAISSSRPASWLSRHLRASAAALVPGRSLRRDLRQRRFLVHGGDRAVELEIFGLLGEASRFQQGGETAVLPDQRRSALRADARGGVRSLTHWPEAMIHSPAEIAAAWPTTVTTSRWPRALARRTQKPLSALW